MPATELVCTANCFWREHLRIDYKVQPWEIKHSSLKQTMHHAKKKMNQGTITSYASVRREHPPWFLTWTQWNPGGHPFRSSLTPPSLQWDSRRNWAVKAQKEQVWLPCSTSVPKCQVHQRQGLGIAWGSWKAGISIPTLQLTQFGLTVSQL